MKKFIALFLALVLCIGLVACGGPGTEQPTNSPEPSESAPAPSAPTTPAPEEPTAADYLADARSYIRAMYKDKAGKVLRDFDVVASVKIGQFTYNITWTTDASEENVKVGEAANNKITIDVNEKPVGEDLVFSLTATVTADGKSESTSFEFYVPATKASGTTFVDAPEVGATYKFGLVQAELGQTLYFTGEMSGSYLATSTSPADAIDVTVEAVDGGHRLYFMKGDVKTYIDVVPRGADSPGKVNAILTDAPTCVFTWDAERKTYTTVVEENPWYLGCYSSYNTISPSATSYIEDVTKIGVSQFPAGLCTVNIVAEQVAAPVADTAYKFAVVQNELGQTLYFTGEMSGSYLATSVNPAEGVNIFVENAEGGVRLYFMKGDVKTYIDVVPRGADSPGKVNAILTDAPTCVFTWDAERKTYTTVVEENPWYLGCYSSYNTISPSATSYIEDVTKIGVSQFPAGPYTVEGFMDVQPSFEEDPEVVVVPTDPAEIVDAAYALGAGASLPYSCTLTGTVVSINTPWSEQYGNITVTIAVEGSEDQPIMCFRLKGEGASTLAVGDVITVTGTLKNYNGTIEFDSGCNLDALGTNPPAEPIEPSDEPVVEPVVAPTNPAEIVDAGYALEAGASLPYSCTLTGTVVTIDTPWSEQYGNITVSIAVAGKEDQPIMCFRLKGEGAADLAVGNIITVTGTIKNYNGTIEFDSGCTLDAVVVVPTEAAEIVAAGYALEAGAALPYTSTLTGTITTIDTEYSEKYGNITVTIAVEGCEDQPIMCFRLKGEGAAGLAVGDVITVTGTIKNYNGTIEFDAGCSLDAVVSKAPAADTLATAILGAWTDTATDYVLSFTETTYQTLQGETVVNSWTYVWNEDGTMSLTDVTGVFGTCIWEVSIVDGRLIVKDLTFGLSYDCTKN